MKIDLHNHSKYSDGLFTPEELIKKAIEQNVSVFALTDHDSVFGCDEIQEAAKKYDIKFLYKDFRPGFREGQNKARELELYMQKYCGCIFSEEDRYLSKKQKTK